MTRKLDDKLLLDIETNFCRRAYQLKWLSKTQNEFNTTTNTNTFSIYILDHSIHPPPANKELGFKLSRLKRSIFSIFRKHKRILQNLSSTQRHILWTMRYKELIYLPSDKGKEFYVISRNTYNQLALNHLKDNNIYTEVTDIQSTQLENLINNAWTNICQWRNIRNKYKNNFITRNNKLPSFYHPIKTHRTNTTFQIRLLHSHIHEYGHVRNGWNGHRMLVTHIHKVEHRNLEIRKHVTTSLFRYETFFLTFELKVST